jgi:hypothetical protein
LGNTGKPLYVIYLPIVSKVQIRITLDCNQEKLQKEHAMSTKSKVALSEESKPSRRKFFIGDGAAVGAVAVASQTSIGKAVIQEVGSTVKGKSDSKTMTAHMRKYYETTMI